MSQTKTQLVEGLNINTSAPADALAVDTSGRILVGTTSASTADKLIVQANTSSSTGAAVLGLQVGTTTVSAGVDLGYLNYSDSSGNRGAWILGEGDGTWTSGSSHPGRLVFSTTASGDSTPTERLRINSLGQVGIGTASPARELQIGDNTSSAEAISLQSNTSGIGSIYFGDNQATSAEYAGMLRYSHSDDAMQIWTSSTERMRIDSSGRLLVGTSSELTTGTAFPIQAASNIGGFLALGRNDTSVGSNNNIGGMFFYGNDSDGTWQPVAGITCLSDGTHATGDKPGRLVFSTTASGASSTTERMRISYNGTVTIGQASTGSTGADGHYFSAAGQAYHGQSGATPLIVNRRVNDGTLVNFRGQDVEEGTISVSGTTVSYNGAHLARWSQLPAGVERTEILRGSVLSNIDEMCEWAYNAEAEVLWTEDDELPEGVNVGDVKTPAKAAGTEDNEQLNRMKVSDVEGDKNVAGVFQAWDDDDDTYTNDFYCAMTGDFIIRIAQGATVERGDLLMSAGDGTAKPQDDDIIRSKTIAKVTSTNVSCTYDDGSYCVPCVLMAC